jgi:hypothetical protein
MDNVLYVIVKIIYTLLLAFVSSDVYISAPENTVK